MWVDPLSYRFLRGAGLVPAHLGRGPLILMYHSISDSRDSSVNHWSVSVKNFRSHVRILKSKGWTTVCVKNLIQAYSLPQRTVAITFDDGYADNFEHAFRVLSEFGMRATWFVVSNDIGTQASWKDNDNLKQRMLNLKQLKEMINAGMEIGAHTRTHARLTELSPAEIKEEVAGSKKDLEDMLGVQITSFAYPYGLFNDECVETVRKAGFTIACTTRTGWFGSEPDLLRVRRVSVFYEDNLSVFARKIAFADNDVSWPRMTRYIFARLRDRLLVPQQKNSNV